MSRSLWKRTNRATLGRRYLPDESPSVIGITAYGACIGLTQGWRESGPDHGSQSSRDLFKRGRHWVDDTVVHQMLGSWLVLTGNGAR
jgi:hypothetical protein